ncbi:transducin/WD40 repeat-like superfamily protein [Actinidia rufa]|uniref:Transducin/WD40 repeat-like superfamily protein n=1 Tax=Actinidia rufa TaxID=165716 RepID=A0A7J0G5T5_9ERIC|nr:transducin/WD40 repeat-like superfamily protein [Actinidia rufa]
MAKGAIMTDPRRLRGHKATATCCIASRDRPGLVATSGEDGCVCWFDMRCKDVLFVMHVGDSPISSLCFKPGNEDIIYVSSGSEVKAFDVHSITCNSRSCFLAAADDGSDVKDLVYDPNKMGLGHRKQGMSNQAILDKCFGDMMWEWSYDEVITAGLDSKLVMWDFSKGRPYEIVDFSVPDTDGGGSAGQCLNPAFVHSIAVPEVDIVDKVGKVCVVARGDGVVEVIDIESELAAIKSKSSSKPGKTSQSRAKHSALSSDTENQNGRKKLCLDYSLGGHTAAASCVAFSMFGEKGKYIISGGNDRSVKVWDWSRYSNAGETSSNRDLIHLNINLSKKVNWLCSTPADSENLIVCDTSKVVKVYTVA